MVPSELRLKRFALALAIDFVILAIQFKESIKSSKTRRLILSDVVFAIAISLAIIGGIKVVSNIKANSAVTSQAKQAISLANKNSLNHKSSPTLSAKAAPSTVKPSVGTYQVAPNLPETLIIPKIGVNASILAVGLDSDGSIGTPSNVYDTAWYDKSALPNQSGAMLIDGHISSWTSQGVFYNLHKLVAGDTIEVRIGSGQLLSYKVINTAVYPSGNVDMNSALSPNTPGTKALNLISCYGDVIPGTSEFNERIVVYSEQAD